MWVRARCDGAACGRRVRSSFRWLLCRHLNLVGAWRRGSACVPGGLPKVPKLPLLFDNSSTICTSAGSSPLLPLPPPSRGCGPVAEANDRRRPMLSISMTRPDSFSTSAALRSGKLLCLTRLAHTVSMIAASASAPASSSIRANASLPRRSDSCSGVCPSRSSRPRVRASYAPSIPSGSLGQQRWPKIAARSRLTGPPADVMAASLPGRVRAKMTTSTFTVGRDVNFGSTCLRVLCRSFDLSSKVQ